MPPGAARAACTARAPSAATVSALVLVWTHDETGRANPVLRVVGRVVADDVDDRRRRAARVVKIGEPVGQAGAEVQQRGGRLFGHATVAIGHPRHCAFEQAEDRAHAVDTIERGDEVHLRGARIAEADFDTAVDEGSDEALCAVHAEPRRPGSAASRAVDFAWPGPTPPGPRPRR
jgi:hypothetical protein